MAIAKLFALHANAQLNIKRMFLIVIIIIIIICQILGSVKPILG